MLNKYNYSIREKIYQNLKALPGWVVGPLLGLYVGREKAKLRKLLTPLSLILYVTNRCNARCSHCFYWQEINTSQNELTIKQVEKFSNSFKNSLNTLSLTGGEPFLRNDIAEICRIFVLKNKTKKINIASNGYFTEKIINNVKLILEENRNLDLNVQISLDGLEEAHNRIRNIDIFKKAVNTLKNLEKIQEKYGNFHVTIQTTVSKVNLRDIEELKIFVKENFPSIHHGFQFARSAKFDTYNIDQKILENFDPKEAGEVLLSIDEMKEVVKKGFFMENRNNSLLNDYVKLMNEGIIEMKQNKKKFVKCLAGLYDGVIYANGDVAMCEFTKPFANLRHFDYNFYQLWHSDPANKQRQKIKSCFCTHTCNLMNGMRYDKSLLIRFFLTKNNG